MAPSEYPPRAPEAGVSGKSQAPDPRDTEILSPALSCESRFQHVPDLSSSEIGASRQTGCSGASKFPQLFQKTPLGSLGSWNISGRPCKSPRRMAKRPEKCALTRRRRAHYDASTMTTTRKREEEIFENLKPCFRRAVARLREASGRSPEKLAKQAGIDPKTLRRMEEGRGTPLRE